MGLIIYPAAKGAYKNGNETLMTMVEEDLLRNPNLLNRPSNVNYWTAGNSATLTQQDNRTIKITNGAATTGYAGQGVSTTANKYYLFRAYAYNDDSVGSYIAAGTSLGSTGLGYTASDSSSKVHELIVKASGATTYFILVNTNTNGAISYWSNVEVIELETLGVDETTEEQTNGTFDTDATGWASNAATLSAPSGKLIVTLTAASGGAFQDISGLTAGQVYKVTVDTGLTTGTSFALYVYDGSAFTTPVDTVSTSSTNSSLGPVYVKPTGTSIRVYLEGNGASSDTFEFDNVRVTKTGNLIGCGSFAYSEGWTLGADWSITGGKFIGSNGGGIATSSYQSIDVSKDDVVIITYTIDSITTTGSGFRWGIGGNLATYRSSAGTYSETLTLLSLTDTNLLTDVSSVTAIQIDNVSIRKAIPAIDSNGDGLLVFGEIPKVPVNYNSTAYAYANFSANNYLQQPYNANLEPASGDFSISIWAKMPATTSQLTLLQRAYYIGGSYSGSAFQMAIQATTSYIQCSITDDGFVSNDNVVNTNAVDDDIWHNFQFIIDNVNNLIYLRIDGSAIASASITNAVGSLSNSNAILRLGLSQADNYPLTNGMLAIGKIDIGNAWTAQYSKTVYDSEAVLFKPDAAFGVVGTNIYLECDMATTDDTPEHDVHISQSLSKKNRVDTIISEQDSFSNVLTQFPESKVKDFKKFRDESRGQVFTFDAKAYRYSQYDPRSVKKTTINEQINRDGQSQYFTMSFNVQDVS